MPHESYPFYIERFVNIEIGDRERLFFSDFFNNILCNW